MPETFSKGNDFIIFQGVCRECCAILLNIFLIILLFHSQNINLDIYRFYKQLNIQLLSSNSSHSAEKYLLHQVNKTLPNTFILFESLHLNYNANTSAYFGHR